MAAPGNGIADFVGRGEAAVMKTVFAILAGLICGVISGFGIGGGSLLMIYLTAIAAIGQKAARGINLLYFLPTAAASLILHAKNRFVKWQLVIPGAVAGCMFGAAAALLSDGLDNTVLQKIFAVFLLPIGVSEILTKKPSDRDAQSRKNQKN